MEVFVCFTTNLLSYDPVTIWDENEAVLVTEEVERGEGTDGEAVLVRGSGALFSTSPLSPFLKPSRFINENLFAGAA